MRLPLIIVSTDDDIRLREIERLLNVREVRLEHPDVLVLSEKLGVEVVKTIREFLSWKPAMAKKRFVVINPADALTLDAQNGLLKVLEEPAGDAVIMLGISHVDALLPTVVSRCEVYTIQGVAKEAVDTEYIKEIMAKDPEERLGLLEKIDDRKKLFYDLLHFYHQNLPNHLLEVKSLLQAERWLKQNVAAKGITDYLMVVLPRVVK